MIIEQIEYDEIREKGFVVDAFFSTDPDCPTYGLNIALAWPFPEVLKDAYEKLRRELIAFGDDVYVYPYESTHITVMTLVDFKKHLHPRAEEIEEIEQRIPTIVRRISDVLQKDLQRTIRPFEIEIGSPVLSRAAAYLPIANPSGEIFLLRNSIAPIMERDLALNVGYNKDFIHATIMRFARLPDDQENFMDTFRNIAGQTHMGKAVIDEIYLTSETRPYMREGKKLHSFYL